MIRQITFPPEGIHSVDFGTYDEATNRVICLICRQALNANAWAKPCPGGVWCQECFCFTNHATEDHQAAAAELPEEPTR